jgi:hypothetical protein
LAQRFDAYEEMLRRPILHCQLVLGNRNLLANSISAIDLQRKFSRLNHSITGPLFQAWRLGNTPPKNDLKEVQSAARQKEAR